MVKRFRFLKVLAFSIILVLFFSLEFSTLVFGDEASQIKFQNPPIKVQVDNRVYQLGYVREGNGKYLFALDSKAGKTAEIMLKLKEEHSGLRVGQVLKDHLAGMEFVFVKRGCFKMGDTIGDGEEHEKPVHQVCLDDFYIGKYEVTIGQFRDFVDNTGYRTEADGGGGCFY